MEALAQSQMMKISSIKKNPANPRFIRDEKYAKLLENIKNLPTMLEYREIIVDEDMIILGGNMRYRACKELGFTEIPVKILTKAKIKQAIEAYAKLGKVVDEKYIKDQCSILDNVNFGEFNLDMLTGGDWDTTLLAEWGVETDFHSQEYGAKNKEVNVNDFSEKMTMTLSFTESEYEFVKTRCADLAETLEHAILQSLGYGD